VNDADMLRVNKRNALQRSAVPAGVLAMMVLLAEVAAVDPAAAAPNEAVHNGAISSALLPKIRAASTKTNGHSLVSNGLARKSLSGDIGAADLDGTQQSGNVFTNIFVGRVDERQGTRTAVAPSSVGRPAGRSNPDDSTRVVVLEPGTAWTKRLVDSVKDSAAHTIVIEAPIDDEYRGAASNGVWMGKSKVRQSTGDTEFEDVGAPTPMFPSTMTKEAVIDWLADSIPHARVKDAKKRLLTASGVDRATGQMIEADVQVDERGAVLEVTPVYDPGTVPLIVPQSMLASVRNFRTELGLEHDEKGDLRTRSPKNALVATFDGKTSETGKADLLPSYAGSGAAADVEFDRKGGAPKKNSQQRIWMSLRGEWGNGVEEWRGTQRDPNGSWSALDRGWFTAPAGWSKSTLIDAVNRTASAPDFTLESSRFKYIDKVWLAVP
jgi:hypothetical protein